jgi:hypothetical protein
MLLSGGFDYIYKGLSAMRLFLLVMCGLFLFILKYYVLFNEKFQIVFLFSFFLDLLAVSYAAKKPIRYKFLTWLIG